MSTPIPKKKTNSSANKNSLYIKRMWQIFAGCIALGGLMLLLIAGGIIGYMPSIDELENPKNRFASEVYSSDMKVLGRYFYSKDNRVWVEYSEISPYLIDALVATEDERFYDHSGIDIIALGRAFVKRGLLFQKNAGGGSTISQQLAKLLYSPRAKNAIERLFQKPIEWVIAVKLEKYYTKDEIVLMYLNKFDFLYNAVGIKSASNVYFGKEPSELNIQESALLVGMCKNPSYFNPVRRPQRATGRRNVVLDQMRKADKITQEQYDQLVQTPLNLHFTKQDHKEGLAPYFREYLRMIMMADQPSKGDYASWQKQKYSEDSLAWINNPLYGWCNKNRKPNGDPYNVYTDGLKIYTTINAKMQQYAEEAVTQHVGFDLQPKFFAEKKGRSYAPFSKSLTQKEVDDIMTRAMKQTDRYREFKRIGLSEKQIKASFYEKSDMQVFTWNGLRDTIMTPMDSLKYYKHFLRAGFMSMDPYTGYVKAYVGGINYAYFQYDMAIAGKRQVGSTIKPYLYTLAMENGFTPCDQTRNVQQTYITEAGQSWTPRNSSKKNIGDIVSLRWGLANSNNWISAWVMSQLNPYDFVNLLHSLGVKGYIDPVLSLCLGPCDISVAEMVSGYSAFVNKGVKVDPLMVTRIEDNAGNVLASFAPVMTEVFSEQTSYTMLDMLQAVINEGTGGRLRGRYQYRGAVGGKTGTTQNNSDGWFIAFTPSLVTGVWIGGEERSIHFDNMTEGQGASMALPIWAMYMNKVIKDPDLGYSQNEQFKMEGYKSCAGDQAVPYSNNYIGSSFDSDF